MRRLLPLVALLGLGACTIGPTPSSTGPTPLPSVSESTVEESPSPGPTDSLGSPAPTDSMQGSPAPSASTSASTEPSPGATPSASVTPPIGSFRAPGELLDLRGEFTTTVLDSKRARISGHRENQVLVMVKSCNVAAAAGIGLSWEPWVLLGPDSEEYPASATVGNAEPKPVYPNGPNRLYRTGQCAKGWIVFDVPAGARLASVRFMNEVGDVGQWRLSGGI